MSERADAEEVGLSLLGLGQWHLREVVRVCQAFRRVVRRQLLCCCATVVEIVVDSGDTRSIRATDRHGRTKLFRRNNSLLSRSSDDWLNGDGSAQSGGVEWLSTATHWGARADGPHSVDS